MKRLDNVHQLIWELDYWRVHFATWQKEYPDNLQYRNKVQALEDSIESLVDVFGAPDWDERNTIKNESE